MNIGKSAACFFYCIGLGCGPLFLAACNSEKTVTPKAASNSTSDRWSSAGRGSIPTFGPAITATVRRLAFSDGMAISYDGSDSNLANQEVCRQETHNGQEVKVCMDLANTGTPVFFGGPVGGDFFAEAQFSSTLACYVDGAQTACTTVFQTIGNNMGETFSCETDLVNGDKALKCSDDWAIVVNGDEDEQEKTICRVNLADNSGRCLSAPKQDDQGQDIPVEELIMEMQKTAWQGYRSGNANSGQVLLSATLSPVATPTNTPEEASFSYASADTNVCTVVASGAFTATGTAANKGTCKIILTVEAQGFVDRVIIAEVEVVEDNDTTWTGGYAGDALYPGESRTVNTAPADGSGISPDLTYTSLTTSICTVDEDDGTVATVAAGECRIQLSSTSDGHLSVEVEQSVTVSATQQFTSLAWANFPASATVGTEVDLSGGNTGDAPVATPAATTTTIAVDSGDCAWNANKFTFSDTTECVVSVTVELRGYDDLTQLFRVTPAAAKATQSAPSGWNNPYGSSPAIAVGADSSAPSNPPGGQGDLVYRVKSGSTGCSVISTTGVVKGINTNGGCTIEAQFAGNANYQSSGHSDVATITINLGTQTVPASTDIYPDDVVVNTSINPSASLPSGGQGTLALRVWSQANPSGGSASTVCSVNQSDGKVTAGANMGTCYIHARFAAVTNQYSASNWVNISGAAGIAVSTLSTFTSITWTAWSNTDGANPGDTIDFTGSMPTSSPGADTITVSVDSGGCGWDDTEEELTYRSDAGDCVISVLAEKSGYTDKTETFTVTVAEDLSSVIALAYTSTLRIGGANVSPSTSASATAGVNNASVAYSGQGLRGSTPTAGICSVAAGTGAITIGNSAQVSDICRVTATYTASGYHTETRTADVTVQSGEFGAIAWSDFATLTSGATSGQTVDFSSNMPTSSVASTTITISASGGCSWDDSNKELTFDSTTLCTVTVEFSKTGYTTKDADFTATATLPLTAQTVTAPVYSEGANLYVGDGNKVWVASGGTTDATSPSIVYSVAGEESDGTAKDNVCSVNSGNGQITIGSAAAATDVCRVTVDFTASGYSPASEEVELTVEAAITFAQLKSRIFDQHSCNNCHGAGGYAGAFTANQAAMNSYTASNPANTFLHASDPSSSELYKRVDDDSMPIGGAALSAKDKEFVAAYIRGGYRTE